MYAQVVLQVFIKNRTNIMGSATSALQDTTVMKTGQPHVLHVPKENMQATQSCDLQEDAKYALWATMENTVVQKNVMGAKVDFIIIELLHLNAKVV